MPTVLLVAVLAVSQPAVNLGKVAPFHESPFVNLFMTHNGTRENGAYSFDVVPPEPGMHLHVQWDGIDPNGVWVYGESIDFHSRSPLDYTKTEYQVHEPTRLNVQISDPLVENLEVYWSRDANADLFTQPFLDAIEPFETLRMLEWTSANTSTVRDWSDRPTMQDPHGWGYGGNGVPLEVQVELANRTGKTLWLPIPHTSTEDYQRNLAQYLGTALDPELDVIVEFSNEVWNGMFPQFDSPRNYGQDAQALFDIFEQELGDARVTNVLSGQAVSPFILRTALKEVDDAEMLAVSVYARVEPDDMERIYRQYLAGERPDDLIFQHLMSSVSNRFGPWNAHANLARQLGVPLVGYEAGQSIVTYTLEQRDDRQFVDWLNTLQDDPRMEDLYRHLSQTWERAGGDELVWYNLSDSDEPSGGWGLRESFDGSSIKWDTVMSLLDENDPVNPIITSDGALIDGELYPIGDSNLDREFDTTDLIVAFSSGEYEDSSPLNSTWEEGDWDTDNDFTTSDLVFVLQAHGRILRAMPVPEPNLALFFAAAMLVSIRRLALRIG